jgi:hypothetical protein
LCLPLIGPIVNIDLAYARRHYSSALALAGSPWVKAHASGNAGESAS